MKTVQILRNIGTNDFPRLQLDFSKVYLEGDTVELEDPIADRLIKEGLAREWTAEAQREDEERRRRAHEARVLAAMPEAERQIALDKAKEEAKGKAASRAATLPATPATITGNPHTPPQKTP